MKKPPRLDLNPSSADRWTTCTASPHFILENHDKVPVSSDTRYNQEGTTAHEVAAALLQNRLPGKVPTPIDGDMLSHAWNYMEYVLSLAKPGAKVLIEQKMPLWYMPERNAIVDAAVINEDSLHVVDYKYGEGVPVSPVENKQGIIYAKSAVNGTEFMDDFPVFIHIYQPRGRAGETGPGHVWETTWGEVSIIARDIAVAAEIIQRNRPEDLQIEFAPSDKACQWCPAKGFCTARRDSLAEGFEVLSPEVMATPKHLIPAVLDLDRDVLAILKYGDKMKKFIDDVHDWSEDFARKGGKIPGYKLVMSRGGNRQWSDPQKAKELLLSQTVLKVSEVVEEKIASPAAVEKLLGKKKFSPELTNLIVKPPGAPVLAPEDDKREAVGIAAVSDFEVLTVGKPEAPIKL
jgi:hypothetical protein